jgi:hypothetical protein
VLIAGAEFCFDAAVGCTTTTVTDNGTGDENPATGVICVGGLAPGTYYVNETAAPTGYGSATESDVAVVATQGTNCDTNVPTGTGEVAFHNAPLYDLQVNFKDGGSGETSVSSIDCTNVGTPGTVPATGWDASNTYTGESAPQTVVCTIVVDP